MLLFLNPFANFKILDLAQIAIEWLLIIIIMVEAAKKPAKSYETYKKVKTLGTGSFGVAYLVECQTSKVGGLLRV